MPPLLPHDSGEVRSDGNSRYMDTPVGENDIKYRWRHWQVPEAWGLLCLEGDFERRLRDTFGITSEEAIACNLQ